MRYKKDFLDFCQDDLHWFQMLVQQILLTIFACYKRIDDKSKADYKITLSLTVVIIRHIITFVLVYVVFFTRYQFKNPAIIKSLVALSIILNACLIW